MQARLSASRNAPPACAIDAKALVQALDASLTSLSLCMYIFVSCVAVSASPRGQSAWTPASGRAPGPLYPTAKR